MRLINSCLVLVLALAQLPAAAHADPPPAAAPAAEAAPVEIQPATPPPPPPSFQPGASVTLLITLKAPHDWNLNHLVPLRLKFDPEYLKTAPFKTKQDTWDFQLASYLPEYTTEIPIALNQGLADGVVSLPLNVMCSVCESTGEQCTFCVENFHVKLVVKGQPTEDDADNQALAQGSLEFSYRLSLP